MSPPPFFPSPFLSVFFLFRSPYLRLRCIQTSPRDASELLAHFTPCGLSFLLFPKGAKKLGRNPFSPSHPLIAFPRLGCTSFSL